jgi:hypothetical protein
MVRHVIINRPGEQGRVEFTSTWLSAEGKCRRTAKGRTATAFAGRPVVGDVRLVRGGVRSTSPAGSAKRLVLPAVRAGQQAPQLVLKVKSAALRCASALIKNHRS